MTSQSTQFADCVVGIIVSILTPLFFTSCSSFQTTDVPAISNVGSANEKAADFLQTSEVMFALKVEIARALREIKDLREGEYKGHPLTTKDSAGNYRLEFKKGTGSFSGKTAIVQSESGAISALLPFTGYAGSFIVPAIGGSRSATSTQTTQLSFRVDPNLDEFPADQACKEIEKIKVHDFIKDALVTSYKQILDVPVSKDYSNDGKGSKWGDPFSPSFVPTTLTLATTFVVRLGADVGANPGTFVIAPAPDVDRFSGNLKASRAKENTYTLSLSLPFTVSDPPDSRRMFYAVGGTNGNLIIEEPFDETRYNTLLTKSEYFPVIAPPVVGGGNAVFFNNSNLGARIDRQATLDIANAEVRRLERMAEEADLSEEEKGENDRELKKFRDLAKSLREATDAIETQPAQRATVNGVNRDGPTPLPLPGGF